MKVQRAGWTAAILGVMVWSVGFAQERRAQRPAERGAQRGAEASAGQLYKASDIIGMDVRGENEAQLGKVQDLLINSRSEEVQFAVLGGGGPQSAAKQTVIPWMIAQTHAGPRTERPYISLSLTEERYKSAPQINLAEAELTTGAEWASEVNRFFNTEMQQRRTARPELREEGARPGRTSQPRSQQDTDRPGARRDTARAERGETAQPQSQLYKASELLGLAVRGENDTELGDVQDLLINSETQEVQFATLRGGPLAQLDGKATVIPWMLTDVHARPGAEQRFISVSLTEDRLKTAPQINVAEAELTPNADWTTQVNQFFATEIQQRRVARPDLREDEPGRERPNRQRNPDRNREGRSGQSDQPQQDRP